MTLQEQYTRLLEKGREKEVLAFLQALGAEERRALAPHVQKLSKEYFKFEQVGNTYKHKASQSQSDILYTTAFVCYNRKEFSKAQALWFLSKEYLNKILPWYCPSWFGEYVNGLREEQWLPHGLTYHYLVELAQGGYLQPHPQLWARTLPDIVYEHHPRPGKHYFRPANLLRHEVTLKEHIWYLFEYETPVSFVNTYTKYEGYDTSEVGWITVFRKLAAEGNIDRQRLLREALLASNRNFNKNLSGWFAELFVQLQPSAEELLSLQPELSVLFSSPHSKPVNVALQSVKEIVDSPSFNADAFLDHVPLLLASETKATVTTTLSLLEKLAKKLPAKRALLCALATGALIHKDDTLQARAARLIEKWGDPADADLAAAILPYTATLFSKAKALLQAFTGEEPAEDTATASAPEGSGTAPSLADAERLPAITDVDELVFLASQAFDNNHSWHIDLLPAALLRWHAQMEGPTIAKLEPAFQRALKLFYVEWTSRLGYLDQLLAYFFLDYGMLLMQRDPAGAASLRKLYESFIAKHPDNWKQWQEHGTNINFLPGWKHHSDAQLYEPYRHLLTTVLERLRSGNTLPLLSTPTHAPAWIDPAVLVDRLHQYAQQGQEPDGVDLQIALSRCWLHEEAAALAAAGKQLHGEDRALLLFLLDRAAAPAGPFIREWAWMMAALAKAPGVVYPQFGAFSYSRQPRARYTGQHPWKVFVEEYAYDKHSWENNTIHTRKEWARRKILQLDLSALTAGDKKENGFKKFWNKITGTAKEEPAGPPTLLYEHLRLKNRWLSEEHKDIRRLVMLTPNNPEPAMALALHQCLGDPSFTGEADKRFTIEVLQALHDLSAPLHETGHLFVATCLTCSDKTAAAYAAELWIRYTAEGGIDHARIGAVLGAQQSIEFAPLKRFTDLVNGRLLGISPRHNRALESLIAALLKALPDTPVTNLKRLLELYFELRTLNGSASKDEELNERLQHWKTSSGLSKLLKTVE